MSRNPHPHVSAAFTLVELLVVILIIMILAGLVVTAVVGIQESARELQTKTRMQTILNGLSQYGANEGGAAVNLQLACSLGGTGPFATIKEITNSRPAGCAAPPGFQMGGTSITDANYAGSG